MIDYRYHVITRADLPKGVILADGNIIIDLDDPWVVEDFQRLTASLVERAERVSASKAVTLDARTLEEARALATGRFFLSEAELRNWLAMNFRPLSASTPLPPFLLKRIRPAQPSKDPE